MHATAAEPRAPTEADVERKKERAYEEIVRFAGTIDSELDLERKAAGMRKMAAAFSTPANNRSQTQGVWDSMRGISRPDSEPLSASREAVPAAPAPAAVPAGPSAAAAAVQVGTEVRPPDHARVDRLVDEAVKGLNAPLSWVVVKQYAQEFDQFIKRKEENKDKDNTVPPRVDPEAWQAGKLLSQGLGFIKETTGDWRREARVGMAGWGIGYGEEEQINQHLNQIRRNLSGDDNRPKIMVYAKALLAYVRRMFESVGIRDHSVQLTHLEPVSEYLSSVLGTMALRGWYQGWHTAHDASTAAPAGATRLGALRDVVRRAERRVKGLENLSDGANTMREDAADFAERAHELAQQQQDKGIFGLGKTVFGKKFG